VQCFGGSRRRRRSALDGEPEGQAGKELLLSQHLTIDDPRPKQALGLGALPALAGTSVCVESGQLLLFVGATLLALLVLGAAWLLRYTSASATTTKNQDASPTVISF